ncbi:hypothetical protein [Maridesulfovibrio sp.]|uniref:hypothetical protein n=1 Tax=Maridesulfovibrio sp. TaxID=2795000 RepID=UPI002A18B002|nr:hypothetical protein [Maridesulfovibrio sp.]
MIDEFGDDHGPLTPKLAQAFTHDPYGLMEQCSWFKFAGKMIGKKEKVLVYDHLEGLGGWTVACETGPVVAVIDSSDPLDEIRAAWPDEKIIFEKHDEILRSADDEFDVIVRFDANGEMSEMEWKTFVADSVKMLRNGGVLIAGDKSDQEFIFLKSVAEKHFNHVFTFGKGQQHPLISPANATIILAC